MKKTIEQKIEKLEKETLSNKRIEQISKEKLKGWYQKNEGVVLVPPSKNEKGFDLKHPDNSCYVEVKGLGTGTTVAFPGRDLTELEYQKFLECEKGEKVFRLFAVFYVGSGKELIYEIPSDIIRKRARPIVKYRIPFRRKEIEKWRLG